MNTLAELEKAFLSLENEQSSVNLNELFRRIHCRLNMTHKYTDDSLFDVNNKISDKKFIASCILRVFNTSHKLIWADIDLRIKVSSLLDSVYAEELYKVIKIYRSTNNHEKFAIFQSVGNETLDIFKKIKNSIVSLETALKVRQSYMKALRHPSAVIFVENHIHNQSLASKERLSEFFNALEEYSQANRMQKLTAYTRLEEIFSSYNKDFDQHIENQYFSILVSEIVCTIFFMAKVNFDESDLQKPAKLTIKNSNRKYPLHAIDQLFSIKLLLVNGGSGVAFDARLNILEHDCSIALDSKEINIGAIDVGKHEIVIKAKVVSLIDTPTCLLGIISWADYKGDRTESDVEVLITPQNGTIDWDTIKYQQPYSLESVDSETDLVGRKDLLENISSKLSLNKGESSILHGQKRVGKTSLARTIQSRFKAKENFITIFIETGSLDKASPEKFVRTLGEKIVKKLKQFVGINFVEAQFFDGSLQPLVSCIEDILALNHKLRIIIILDEFDEIPSQLYPYTEAGDAFFHNLRSLSGESCDGRVSLILVGGENINVIMQSTDKLNKFDAFNVGYFDKARYWDDFKELLTAPVKNTIEFTEEGIMTLYEVTEGNPFYTKFIAKNLYRMMCEKRCSFITSDEMNEAITETILNLEAINVNHFWSDGIRVENSEKRDLIETHRRRFLIAFAERLRNHESLAKHDVLRDVSLNMIPAKEILDSFIIRKIFVDDGVRLKITPRLFEKWLVEKGVHALRASFADEDALSAYRINDRGKGSGLTNGDSPLSFTHATQTSTSLSRRRLSRHSAWE
jgi:hypothetical protein